MKDIVISPIDISIILIYIIGITLYAANMGSPAMVGLAGDTYSSGISVFNYELANTTSGLPDLLLPSFWPPDLYCSGHKTLAGKMKEAICGAAALPENHFGFYEYIDVFSWEPEGAKHQLWSEGVIFVEKAAQNVFIV